jgi:hypothetical protein
MAAARLGLTRALGDLDQADDFDGLTLTFHRIDYSARTRSPFLVRVARVRLTPSDDPYAKLTVAVDSVGKLPPGVRLGNLTAGAFPDLGRTAEFSSYRAYVLAELTPDVWDCDELVVHWRTQLPADHTVVAGRVPVSAGTEAVRLHQLLRGRLAGSTSVAAA